MPGTGAGKAIQAFTGSSDDLAALLERYGLTPPVGVRTAGPVGLRRSGTGAG